MNKQSELVNLIRALSKSEKRYFKLYASKFKDNNPLMMLFNELEKQKNGNRKNLPLEFKNKKKSKQLSVTRDRLKLLILKSMRSFYSNKTIDYKINTMFQNVYFFIHKQLDNQAEKELKKIESLALLHERHNYLLQVIHIRSRILDEKKIKKAHIDTLEVFQKIENKNQFLIIYSSLIKIISEVGTAVRKQDDLKKLQQLIKKPILKKAELAITVYSKIMYYAIHYFYNRVVGKGLVAYNIAQLSIQYMERHPEYIDQAPHAYRNMLYNYVDCQINIRKFDNFIKTIDKMRTIPNTYSNADNKIFRSTTTQMLYVNKLAYYYYSFQYENALSLIGEYEEWIKSNENLIVLSFDVITYTTISKIYFVLSKHKESLKWINRAINIKYLKSPVAAHIQLFAQLFSLFIHYEMGHLDILEYKINSLERVLLKQNKLYESESEIIAFFKIIIQKEYKNENLNKKFQLLKYKLQNLMEHPLEKNFFVDFDFISWVESKIESRPFAEILKDKSLTLLEKK